MSELFDFLSDILGWLLDVLLWVPQKLYELVLDGLAGVLEAIPVPGWLDGGLSLFTNLPAGIVYFADALAIPEGIGIVLGAYLVRFLIRRIPFIG